MKIGVLGPQASCEIIEKELRCIDPSQEVRCYVREQVSACAEILPECEQWCDAILFTGRAVEGYVKRNAEIHKPFTCVIRSSVGMAGAFLQMQKQGLEFDSFSIDIVEPQVIEDVLDAFEIQAKNIYSYPDQEDTDENNYLRWHRELHREGKTAVALTSFRWVYACLRQQGFPAIYLGPTRATTRLALEQLKKDMAINRAESAQIAAEVLRLGNTHVLEENYYSGMMTKTEIDKSVICYTKELQAVMFQEGRWGYIIYANAGVLRNRRSQQLLLKLQEEIQGRGLRLDAGIGVGDTAYRAEINARKALRYTMEHSGGQIYSIDENGVLSGPLFRENTLRYQLISSDHRLQELAEKTGLSGAAILKLRAIIETRQSDIFDAHELADCLEVTSRSARRIMNRLIEAGCGEVYAMDASNPRGRPKALIRIHLE